MSELHSAEEFRGTCWEREGSGNLEGLAEVKCCLLRSCGREAGMVTG